jgi:ABC-2 type transport system permease protein
VTLRLFWTVFNTESRKLMSYRVDFWLNAVVGFFAELGTAWFVWLAIFEARGAETIGGFRFDGMVLYYALAILLGKLVRGQERAPGMSQDIYDGSLSRYLLYPTGYFTIKYAEHLGSLVPALVQLVLFTAVYAGFLRAPAGSAITPLSVLRCALAVVLANLLWFSMLYPIHAIAFWADNVWSIRVMLRFVTEFLGGLLLPLALFPDWLETALAYLPFSYLFAFPVVTLLGLPSPVSWLQGMAVGTVWTGALLVLGRQVWARGYRVYSGVGI